MTDAFFSSEGIMDSIIAGDNQVRFKITDVKREKVEAFGKEQMCVVFHLIDEDKKKSTLAQPIFKQDGTEYKNFFWPMSWDENNEKPRPASLMFDLKDAIKDSMGTEAYEERRGDGNITTEFFKGAEFSARLNSGTSKDGNPYYIVLLPSRALIADWDYQIHKGDFGGYGEIQAVRDAFPKYFDNSKAVEDALGNSDAGSDLSF